VQPKTITQRVQERSDANLRLSIFSMYRRHITASLSA
jgi:hypothetical protein